MSSAQSDLARHLETGFSRAQLSVDAVSERTKIPRTTILHLMGKPISAVLPERVYLQGQVKVVAGVLGLSVADTESLFDAAFPVPQPEEPSPEQTRFRSQSIAVSAALTGVAVLSVVVAVLSALD